MRVRFVAVLAGVLLLQGCGTMQYKPAEYPLRADLIPALPVNGTATVSNNQSSTDPVIVYSYAGSKLASNLHAITDVMVQQTREELKKHGEVAPGGAPKTIALKVDALHSKYSNMFYWKSKLQFEARLGNGVVVKQVVPHASGVLLQDLNGCIAQGVIALLKNDQVRRYLAQ